MTIDNTSQELVDDEAWTAEELDAIIEQGIQAHNELAQHIGESITNLSNIATKVGRYRQLRSTIE